jgi:hypothetical protein
LVVVVVVDKERVESRWPAQIIYANETMDLFYFGKSVNVIDMQGERGRFGSV